MPAAFNRADGRYLFHANPDWRAVGLFGGTQNLLYGTNFLVTGTEQIVCTRPSDGSVAFAEMLPASAPTTGTRQIAMDGDRMYVATGRELTAMNLPAWQAEQQRRDRLFGAQQRILDLQDENRWNDETIEDFATGDLKDLSPEDRQGVTNYHARDLTRRDELVKSLALAQADL